jgi:hypothetical protein
MKRGNLMDNMPSVVVIRNDRQGLTEFIRELVPQDKPAHRAAVSLSADDSGKVAAVLETLAQHKFNIADGGVRAKIGSYQFPLRRTLYTALTLTVTFTGSVVAALVEPVGGGIALAGTVMAAIQQAGDLINELTPDEVDVYEALGTAMVKKRAAGQEKPRALVADVEQVFDQRNQAPPDVADTLRVLSERKAIQVAIVSGRPQYWIQR